MKKIFRKLNLAALVIVGAMAVGCTGALEEIIPNTPEETTPGIPEETQQQPESETVTLTTTISLGTETKALDAEGVKTFAVGDQIAVVYEDEAGLTQKAVSVPLTAEKIREAGKKADISVTLDAPKSDGALRYIYPAAMALETIATDATIDDAGTIDFTRLDAQDGTLASLAANLDLAVFDGNFTAAAELPASATLENKFTIGEFTIKNAYGSSNITNTITRLTVSDGTNTYAITRSAAEGPIYVAMKPLDGGNLDFTASDGVNFFDKSVSGKTLAAGSMYPIGLKMNTAFDGKATPLTFEAINACTVTYTAADPSMTVQYNKNGEGWTGYNAAINLAAGEILAFRGMNDTYRTFSTFSYFTCSDDCYLYGNIMSLVTDYTSDPNAFAENVVLKEARTFYGLFYDYENHDNSHHIKSHVSNPIVLPATTLTENCYGSMFQNTGLTVAPVLPAITLTPGCYSYMFENCTSLTTAPALPATELKSKCYQWMFSGCTSLIAAPALPATELGGTCYDHMFSGCIGLTVAPELPATNLAKNCYQFMFSGCTGLTVAPELPATNLADYCYYSMFSGCTGLTVAPKLPATYLANYCYQSMFSGCTGLTTAPVLPAPVLKSNCYSGMFYNCTNINNVTCYALYIPSEKCSKDWLKNTSSGTLQIHPVLDLDPGWTDRYFNKPEGWTVERHVVATKTLANASWEDVGRIIGADGNIYSTVVAAEEAGTTAQAMVAYIGTVDGVCEHGLAISLSNVSDSERWSEIDGVISTWASSHPIPVGSWRLPSFKDWQYLLIGTYIEDPGYYDYITTTNVLLSGVGGSLSDGEYYWSSTSMNEYVVYSIYFNDSSSYGECTLNCEVYKEDEAYVVRACFAF